MAKPDKKTALKRLTKARESLANSDVWNYGQRNEEVAKAEKAVHLGRMRGWKY